MGKRMRHYLAYYKKEKNSDKFKEIPKKEYIESVNNYLLDMMELEWIAIV